MKGGVPKRRYKAATGGRAGVRKRDRSAWGGRAGRRERSGGNGYLSRNLLRIQGLMGIYEHAEAGGTASDLKGSEGTTLRAHMGLEMLGVRTGQSGKTS